MPLTEFQIALAGCLAENRTFDSYLAGGAAILMQPNSKRYSNDLDYFHDSENRVAEAFAADRELLEAHGYTLRVDLNQPGYIRAVVQREECSTKVEWAACGKDPGFTPLSLLELLRRRGRVRPEDLARLNLAVDVDLKALKSEWLGALGSVEPFVYSRPSEEIGCLYYSASRRSFVDPRLAEDAVPRFGRPGGVLPRVGDT